MTATPSSDCGGRIDAIEREAARERARPRAPTAALCSSSMRTDSPAYGASDRERALARNRQLAFDLEAANGEARPVGCARAERKRARTNAQRDDAAAQRRVSAPLCCADASFAGSRSCSYGRSSLDQRAKRPPAVSRAVAGAMPAHFAPHRPTIEPSEPRKNGRTALDRRQPGTRREVEAHEVRYGRQASRCCRRAARIALPAVTSTSLRTLAERDRAVAHPDVKTLLRRRRRGCAESRGVDLHAVGTRRRAREQLRRRLRQERDLAVDHRDRGGRGLRELDALGRRLDDDGAVPRVHDDHVVAGHAEARALRRGSCRAGSRTGTRRDRSSRAARSTRARCRRGASCGRAPRCGLAGSNWKRAIRSCARCASVMRLPSRSAIDGVRIRRGRDALAFVDERARHERSRQAAGVGGGDLAVELDDARGRHAPHPLQRLRALFVRRSRPRTAARRTRSRECRG